MKLTTLLEYQRCYNMMKECDLSDRSLTAQEFKETIYAKSNFELELEQITQTTEVEVCE